MLRMAACNVRHAFLLRSLAQLRSELNGHRRGRAVPPAAPRFEPRGTTEVWKAW